MKEIGLLLTKDFRAKSRNGTKTMTRRLVKFPQGCDEFSHDAEKGIIAFGSNDFTEGLLQLEDAEYCRKTPHQIGDKLYLQEPYQIERTDHVLVGGIYLDDKKDFVISLSAPEMKLWAHRKCPFRNTSSRFMYKSLARTWFEVTGVRVERLREMTEGDAIAEGIIAPPMIRTREQVGQLWGDFTRLWDSTNKIKWADNPWVFAITYKRIDK